MSIDNKTRAAQIVQELSKNLTDLATILLDFPDEISHAQETKKKFKDPNAPKRNLSSYMLYSQAVRNSVVAENPTLKPVDIARLIGEKWNALSDKEKQPYIKAAEKEKSRFEKEAETYKSSLGEPAAAAEKPKAAEKSTKTKAAPAKRVAVEATESTKKKSKKTESEKKAEAEKKPKKKAQK